MPVKPRRPQQYGWSRPAFRGQGQYGPRRVRKLLPFEVRNMREAEQRRRSEALASMFAFASEHLDMCACPDCAERRAQQQSPPTIQ
jgi:hypothetical protein